MYRLKDHNGMLNGYACMGVLCRRTKGAFKKKALKNALVAEGILSERLSSVYQLKSFFNQNDQNILHATSMHQSQVLHLYLEFF